MEEFKNGAVVMNDNEEFLCTEDGERLFWEADTEHAICFHNNKEAEDFLNNWNNHHSGTAILNGVRIVSSNCQCGGSAKKFVGEDEEQQRATRATKSHKLPTSLLKLAVEILKNKTDLLNELEEAQGRLEKINEKIEELNDDKEEIQDNIEELSSELKEALGEVFSEDMQKQIIAELSK